MNEISKSKAECPKRDPGTIGDILNGRSPSEYVCSPVNRNTLMYTAVHRISLSLYPVKTYEFGVQIYPIDFS
jgi:hypothetical protein